MKEHTPQSCLSFTEREKLYDQVSHQRFLSILHQQDIEVHELREDTNSFGEFLFVTISCRNDQPRKLYTFYGLGYHDYRERWISDIWQWFESQRKLNTFAPLQKQNALADITEREVFVQSQQSPEPPSRSAEVFSLLADLTDEDGALTDLEDLGWMLLGNDEDVDEGGSLD
jgi:hypothetical protein